MSEMCDIDSINDVGSLATEAAALVDSAKNIYQNQESSNQEQNEPKQEEKKEEAHESEIQHDDQAKTEEKSD